MEPCQSKYPHSTMSSVYCMKHIVPCSSSCVLVADLGQLEIKSDLRSYVPDVRVSVLGTKKYKTHEEALNIFTHMLFPVQNLHNLYDCMYVRFSSFSKCHFAGCHRCGT